MFKFNSLSNRLTTIACFLIAVILIVVNVISYYESKQSTSYYLEEIQKKTMHDVNYMYSSYSNSKRIIIESLAHSLSKIAYNANDREIFSVLDTAKRSGGFDTVHFGLEDSGKDYQIDTKFNLHNNPNKFDPRTRPWYKEAKAAGKLIVTDPYKSIVLNGQVVVTYSIPVFNDNKFVGVVSGVYNLNTFSKDVLALGHSDSSYAGVYDKDGVVIFHEDQKRMLTKTDLSINIANAIKANPDLVDPNKEETLFYAKDGAGKTQVITCNQTLNPKYIVCSITDESVYTDAVNKVLFQQVIIALIAIVIALLLVRFAIIKNLKPIAVITTGLNSFFDFINHKTKDSAMIDVKTNDELGAMAKAINENITKTKNALEQDAKAVEQSV
ncbi:methyl-accepting chemotaxis protein, partial [Campylobacter lari]|nr:methyl-accepting chemotaxis protein [Campylobacter lari]